MCKSNKASNAGVAYDAGMAIGDAGMRVCVHVEPIASAKVPLAGKFVSELVSVGQQAFQNVVRSLIGVSVLCMRGSRHVRQQTGMLTAHPARPRKTTHNRVWRMLPLCAARPLSSASRLLS